MNEYEVRLATLEEMTAIINALYIERDTWRAEALAARYFIKSLFSDDKGFFAKDEQYLLGEYIDACRAIEEAGLK